MISNGQQSYHPPTQSQGGYASPRQAFQNAPNQSQGFTGFKLGGANPPSNQPQRRPPAKRWTMEQLRASDAIIPLQSGTNQFASQRGMTGFGQPRNTTTPVFGAFEIPREPDEPRPSDAVVPLQYGTNQYASQRGMTGFGAPRDVTGKHIHSLLDEDELPGQEQWQ